MNEHLDMPLWKKARSARDRILEIIDSTELKHSSFLNDDLKRSANAMEARIRLGFCMKEPGDTLQQFSIARGKSARLYAMLLVCSDRGYIKAGDFVETGAVLDEISADLTGIMKLIKPDLDEWKKDIKE